MIDQAIKSVEEVKRLAEEFGLEELANDLKGFLIQLKEEAPKKDWRKRPITPRPPRR